MDYKAVLWYVGVMLLLLSSLMVVSGIIAIVMPGDDSAESLFFAAFLTLNVGLFPLMFVKRGNHKMTSKEGNFIVVVLWLTACLFGAFPFLFYGGPFSVVNSLFESVSGFTTTGASILEDVESVPAGLQFWRISTAWVGGMGVVTLFSMLVVRGMDQSVLYGAELSSVATRTVHEKKASFAKQMLVTYITLTLVTFFSLKLSGMRWFDSAVNAMSTCSTCGFSTRSDSIGAWNNPAAEWILIFAMLAAGINFVYVFLTFVKGSQRNVFKSEISRTFLSLVGIAVLIIFVDLVVNGAPFGFGTLRKAAFQVVSLSTTTGFATADTTGWPYLCMGVLLVCSIVCGCSGSTSGGIKVDRLVLAVKGLGRNIMDILHPGVVVSVKVDGQIKSDKQVSDAYAYFFIYFMLLIVFAIVNIIMGMDATSGFTASVACIGNVGPGFGEIGSMSNYAHLPVAVKFSNMFEMILGRLEIYPIVSLLASFRRASS